MSFGGTPEGVFRTCLTDGLGDDKVPNTFTIAEYRRGGLRDRRCRSQAAAKRECDCQHERGILGGACCARSPIWRPDAGIGQQELADATACGDHLVKIWFEAGAARAPFRDDLAALVPFVLADLRAFAQSNANVGASGLPLPRYVSLKSDRVNLRQGPGTDYPTAWVYRRAGLPLEVIEEYEAWRKVRDSEGTTGWILSSLLSGRRTALVLPWELKADTPRPQVPLRRSNSTSARAVAMIEAGVIADIQSCDGQWCYVVIDAFRGYLEQGKLWGVYSREKLE
jgi:SH3-like domain-containing protein